MGLTLVSGSRWVLKEPFDNIVNVQGAAPGTDFLKYNCAVQIGNKGDLLPTENRGIDASKLVDFQAAAKGLQLQIQSL